MKIHTIERELSIGKRYAYLVFRSKKHSNSDMIVEVKYDKSAEGEKKKRYINCLKDYSEEI